MNGHDIGIQIRGLAAIIGYAEAREEVRRHGLHPRELFDYEVARELGAAVFDDHEPWLHPCLEKKAHLWLELAEIHMPFDAAWAVDLAKLLIHLRTASAIPHMCREALKSIKAGADAEIVGKALRQRLAALEEVA